MQHAQRIEHEAETRAALTEVWHAGPPASEIRFYLHDLALAEISGRVGRWSATLALDLEQPSRSAIDVVIDAGSLETGASERDNHTRSPEFLNIAAYPDIRFRSRDILVGDGDRGFIVVGDLTVRHLTREVRVAVRAEVPPPAVPAQERRLAFTARASISRQDFGLRWHEELGGSSLIASDKIDLEIRVDARRQP